MSPYRFDNKAVFCSNTRLAGLKHHLHYENKGFKTGTTPSRPEGIHEFCITIDKQARDYLPHMHGTASYTVIDDVASLPVRVPDSYRGLTG
jgi:nitric oxide reductase activation protein